MDAKVDDEYLPPLGVVLPLGERTPGKVFGEFLDEICTGKLPNPTEAFFTVFGVVVVWRVYDDGDFPYPSRFTEGNAGIWFSCQKNLTRKLEKFRPLDLNGTQWNEIRQQGRVGWFEIRSWGAQYCLTDMLARLGIRGSSK